MKVIDRRQIVTTVKEQKARGLIIVFTNGCFDILHAGHVRYLTEAKALGDVLIVGLNSDSSVTSLKGPGRPVNCQEDRAEVLSALTAVDYVVIFEDATAEGLVADILPDVYAKGGDYAVKNLPEAEIVTANGGRAVILPEVPGRSSSNIISKARLASI